MYNILKKIYNPKEKQDEKNRIYYFDNMKFILILLVVLGHLVTIIFPNKTAISVWLFTYSFHMPLFIFLSGFFAKSAIKRKDKSKVINYMSLYLILKLLILIVTRMWHGINTTLNIFLVKSVPWYLFAMGVWYAIAMMTNKINKKYLLIFSFILAIIVGYDKDIGDWMGLSRIITFLPFFILGTMTTKEKIESLTSNKKVKIISVIVLILLVYVCVAFIDNIYFIRPIITGKNSYYALGNDLVNYGGLIRGAWYFATILISIIVMNVIPKGKTLFTSLGSRTLAVYFIHAIVFRIFELQALQLRVYQYILVSIVITLICSLRFISTPFNRFMQIDYYKGSKE